MGLMKNFFGDDSLTDDKYLALSMLSSAKFTAASYLAATLAASTPEIRHLFSGFSTQVTQAHEVLMGLATQKGWYNVYGEPKSQLQEVIKDSMKVISTNA